jgi:hypothetical protein
MKGWIIELAQVAVALSLWPALYLWQNARRRTWTDGQIRGMYRAGWAIAGCLIGTGFTAFCIWRADSLVPVAGMGLGFGSIQGLAVGWFLGACHGIGIVWGRREQNRGEYPSPPPDLSPRRIAQTAPKPQGPIAVRPDRKDVSVGDAGTDA